MKLYITRVQLISGEPKKEIKIIEANETEKSYIFNGRRYNKNRVGEFQSKFVDNNHQIFERNSFYLNIKEAEKGIKEMIKIGEKHFFDIQKKAELLYKKITDENFQKAEITIMEIE